MNVGRWQTPSLVFSHWGSDRSYTAWDAGIAFLVWEVGFGLIKAPNRTRYPNECNQTNP